MRCRSGKGRYCRCEHIVGADVLGSPSGNMTALREDDIHYVTEVGRALPVRRHLFPDKGRLKRSASQLYEKGQDIMRQTS